MRSLIQLTSTPVQVQFPIHDHSDYDVDLYMYSTISALPTTVFYVYAESTTAGNRTEMWGGTVTTPGAPFPTLTRAIQELKYPVRLYTGKLDSPLNFTLAADGGQPINSVVSVWVTITKQNQQPKVWTRD
jgi:hypothetical protein